MLLNCAPISKATFGGRIHQERARPNNEERLEKGLYLFLKEMVSAGESGFWAWKEKEGKKIDRTKMTC